MAPNGLFCADVPLSNYSLAEKKIKKETIQTIVIKTLNLQKTYIK